MALAGAISGISAVGSLAGSLFSNDSDPDRLAKNAAAFTLARAGHVAALDYLKARSGRFGEIPVGVVPGVNATPDTALGGWATVKARDDAFNKYQAAQSGAAPIPTPAGGLAGVGNTLQEIGNAITGTGQAVTGAATLTAAQQKAQAALSGAKTFLWVGGLALVGFLAWRAFGRR